MILEIISILIMVIGSAYLFGQGDLSTLCDYIDMPSLISILVLSLPILARNGLWRDFIRGFMLLRKKYSCSISDMRRALDAVEMMQKQVLYAGVINLILGMIAVFQLIDNLSQFGPNTAVILIVVLYTAIIELLLLPVQVEIKRRIIDYMEAE